MNGAGTRTVLCFFVALGCVLFAERTATSQSTSSALPTPKGPPHDHVPALESAVRVLLDQRSLQSAQIGVAVLDVSTGHLLATANEHLPLNPASNAKVLTAAAALTLLHGDHRYETVLLGTVKDSEISGDLVLRGHGDPSLTTADLFSLAEELRLRGIRKINGDLVVDQHHFDGESTPPAFEQQPNEWAAFRAPVAAVSVNENTVTMAVRPGASGQAAHVFFDPPGFVDQDGSVSTAGEGGDTIGLVLSPNGKRLSAKVSGSVGADAKLVRYYRRVEDPTLLAGYALRALLERDGIKVSGEVKEGTRTKGSAIARHTSRPLSELLYELGKASNNFYAEMVFKSLGAELKVRPGRSKDGADMVAEWLQHIGAFEGGMVVRNGSGLFDANRVTAQSLATVLRAAALDPAVAPEFEAQLSIGGVDGTLHRRFRNEKNRRAIRAKTGTLEDVAALSGYVSGPPGKGTLAFSVLLNKIPGKVAAGRAAIDRFVRALVAYQFGTASKADEHEDKSGD